MTFPVLGANGAVAGYSIDNSLRFNDGDSAYLTRTPASEGNRDTFTISFWVKRGTIGTRQFIISPWGGSSSDYAQIEFYSTDAIFIQNIVSNSQQLDLRTNRLFRDVSAWYHIVLAVDSTQATASNRAKLYVNGVQETSFSTETYMSQNNDTYFNDNIAHNIGRRGDGSSYFDGYLTEFYMIDGQQLSPTDFGQFSEEGIWQPIQYTGTYTGNSFYLDFENSGSLGADASGLGNNFTPTNLASTDQTTDTPTNNFATMNPLDSTSATHSEGNLKAVIGTTLPRSTNSTISVSQGKWYCEIKITSVGYSAIGVVNATYNGRYYNASTNPTPYAFTDNVMYLYTGTKYVDGSSSAYGASFTTNDIIGIALNLDDDEITFYKNGSSQGTITTKTFTGDYKIAFAHGGSDSSSTLELNTGNPSFSITSGNSDDNGYGNFEYAPPTGFLALCTQNLATALSPTIDDGSQYFNTVLYTANNSSTKAVTGVGFQPDLVWLKNRGLAQSHYIGDSNRGTDVLLQSDTTGADVTAGATNWINYDSDGFTLNTVYGNYQSYNYAGWNWKANGGTTSSNTDGSITSTVQANTTAGFSIVTYTGTGSLATVGHGLGKTPKMIIWKRRDSATNWSVQGTQSGINTDQTELNLNSTGAVSAVDSRLSRQSQWSSTTFEVNTYTDQNASGGTYVAYCFAEIEGYSKFGKFVGNNSTDGTYCYLGFRPQYIVIKNIDATGGWICHDIARNPYNVSDDTHQLQDSEAEYVNGSNRAIDILSNGFKIRHTDTYAGGGSGINYIYLAFASNPFVSSTGIPVTAR